MSEKNGIKQKEGERTSEGLIKGEMERVKKEKKFLWKQAQKTFIESSGFSASITVEASYIMAIVVFALALLIRTAYVQWHRTTDIIQMHYVVERLRYQEQEQEKSLHGGQVSRNENQVQGRIQSAGWEKEITAGIHEPEEILRKMTIFEQGDQTLWTDEE